MQTSEHQDPMAAVLDTVSACMQCGTCSASCPNADAMDLTPRQLWRLAQLGRLDDIEASKTFWLCSSCYSCTLRCPRGLPLTRTLAALKRVVAGRDQLFYRAFADNVEYWGRVQESTLMARYLAAHPGKGPAFTPVGLRLLMKGKLHPPHSRQKGRLKPLFEKVRQMEGVQ